MNGNKVDLLLGCNMTSELSGSGLLDLIQIIKSHLYSKLEFVF